MDVGVPGQGGRGEPFAVKKASLPRLMWKWPRVRARPFWKWQMLLGKVSFGWKGSAG